jgi:hypothetical protein
MEKSPPPTSSRNYVPATRTSDAVIAMRNDLIDAWASDQFMIIMRRHCAISR